MGCRMALDLLVTFMENATMVNLRIILSIVMEYKLLKMDIDLKHFNINAKNFTVNSIMV